MLGAALRSGVLVSPVGLRSFLASTLCIYLVNTRQVPVCSFLLDYDSFESRLGSKERFWSWEEGSRWLYLGSWCLVVM